MSGQIIVEILFDAIVVDNLHEFLYEEKLQLHTLIIKKACHSFEGWTLSTLYEYMKSQFVPHRQHIVFPLKNQPMNAT